ncbi:hypothetical protein R1flu_003344 [Riccia fluitans]|uniref:Uncharacterized protein n=1 Tax=Riccia fluitans TaxID=41844 RepID=A0ABD1Y9P8_9MARC
MEARMQDDFPRSSADLEFTAITGEGGLRHCVRCVNPWDCHPAIVRSVNTRTIEDPSGVPSRFFFANRSASILHDPYSRRESCLDVTMWMQSTSNWIDIVEEAAQGPYGHRPAPRNFPNHGQHVAILVIMRPSDPDPIRNWNSRAIQSQDLQILSRY